MEIVAVGKTFGVAVRTPVLVAEEISDLFAAAQIAVVYFQHLSEAETGPGRWTGHSEILHLAQTVAVAVENLSHRFQCSD